MSTPAGRRRDAVWLVAQKELREVLRDKRSLYVLLLLPVALYPLLLVGTMLAATAQVRKLGQQRHVVWVEGLAQAPADLVARLSKPEGGAPPDKAMAAASTPGGFDALPLVLVDAPVGADEATYDAALSRGEVVAVVRGAAGAEARAASAATTGDAPRIEVLYNGGRDASTFARSTIERAVASWRQALVLARARAAGLPEVALHPVLLAPRDLGEKGALLARSLSALLVMLALTGAFYPALDLGAGEKERGTLETLLLAPVSRTTLATGKFVAVCVVSAVCAVLHLVSLGLTFSAFGSFLPAGTAVSVPLTVVPAMLAVLLPLVALFSALSLAASTFAASYKEGQAYLTPVILLGTVLSMVAALPGVELGPTLALVPVAGASLLMKALLARTATWGQVVLVTGASLAWAALAIRWVATLYEREDVLLRPAAAGAPDLLGLRRGAGPGPETPSLPQGIALGVGVVLLYVLVGVRLQQRAGLPIGVALTLLLLVAAPAIAYARLLGVSLRSTFALRRPPALAVIGGVLLGLGAMAPIVDLHLLQGPFLGERTAAEQQEAAAQMRELLALPLPVLVLLLAALPGVCEELCFRGFVLRAMLREGGLSAAVLVSATLFAVAHLDPSRLLGTFALGVVLAIVSLRSGSIAPGMLLHATFNGALLVLESTGRFAELLVDGHPTWTWRLASLGLLGLGAALVWPRPRDEKAVTP